MPAIFLKGNKRIRSELCGAVSGRSVKFLGSSVGEVSTEGFLLVRYGRRRRGGSHGSSARLVPPSPRWLRQVHFGSCVFYDGYDKLGYEFVGDLKIGVMGRSLDRFNGSIRQPGSSF